MTILELQNQLTSKKSADRLKAAKTIGFNKNTALEDPLLNALQKELQNSRTWPTQMEMVLALGHLSSKKSLEIIKGIIEENKDFDMVTYAAAQSYVRIMRESLNDVRPVFELLNKGGFSLIDGCLNPLGYDRMMPNNEDIKRLLRLTWDIHKIKPKGYTDPRYGIAAACAGWNPELTHDFLQHCLDTAGKDTPLIYVAKNALEGRYVKLR